MPQGSEIFPQRLWHSTARKKFSNILVQKTLIIHLILEGGHCAQPYGYLWKVYKKLNSILGGECKFWFPGERERALKVWEATDIIFTTATLQPCSENNEKLAKTLFSLQSHNQPCSVSVVKITFRSNLHYFHYSP